MKKKLFSKIVLLVLTFALLCSTVACTTASSNPNVIEPSGSTKVYSDVELAKNGTSSYKIVIPDDVASPAKGAAQELRRIFEMATGYRLPIVSDTGLTFSSSSKYISIGDTSIFTGSGVTLPTQLELNYDGFIVKRVGNTVLLNAREETAYYYAALELCEQNFDYRWYAEDCEKVGNFTAGTVKLIDFNDSNYKFVPDFAGRNLLSFSNFESAESKIHLRGNNQMTNMNATVYGQNGVDSSLHDQSICMQLVPVTEYYQAHPQWYAIGSADTTYLTSAYTEDLKKSSTTAWSNVKNNVQICYTKAYNTLNTSGGLGYTLCENLKQVILNEPTKCYFSVTMTDNRTICNCSDCQTSKASYGATGVYQRFFAALGNKIKSWQSSTAEVKDRNISLVIFAYLDYINPPVSNGALVSGVPKLPDNVVVRIAPWIGGWCHYKPFNDPNNENAYEDINNWKIAASRFAVWEYGMASKDSIQPYPTWNAVQANYRLYKDMGVEDIYVQSNLARDVTFERMDNYVRLRLMWEVDLNYQDLAYDFMRNYFAEAGEYMIQYFNLTVQHYYVQNQSSEVNAYPTDYKFSSSFWPVSVIKEMKDIFDKAYTVADGLGDMSSTIRARLDRESSFYRYVALEHYASSIYGSNTAIADAIRYYAGASTICNETLANVTKETQISNWLSTYGVTL